MDWIKIYLLCENLKQEVLIETNTKRCESVIWKMSNGMASAAKEEWIPKVSLKAEAEKNDANEEDEHRNEVAVVENKNKYQLSR